MSEIGNIIDSLFNKAVDYGKTTIEIIKLKAVNKASDVISTNIPRLVFIILIAFSLLFFNLGLAFWLSDLLGKVYLGFLVVGGFYLLLGIILQVFFHNAIKKAISNYIVKHMLK